MAMTHLLHASTMSQTRGGDPRTTTLRAFVATELSTNTNISLVNIRRTMAFGRSSTIPALQQPLTIRSHDHHDYRSADCSLHRNMGFFSSRYNLMRASGLQLRLRYAFLEAEDYTGVAVMVSHEQATMGTDTC
jgi:hypothetical protein